MSQISYTQVPSLVSILEGEIESIRQTLLHIFTDSEIMGCLLIGSCSRGEATYRSDIDLLIVLCEGPLTYSRVRDLRDRFDEKWAASQGTSPLHCELHFVLRSVFETKEPAMRKALLTAISLIDKMGALKNELHRLKGEND